MRFLLLLCALTGCSLLASARAEPIRTDSVPPQYAADVAGLDTILNALYASISGAAGEKRDWDRFRHLFTADARLMPSRRSDGPVTVRIMSPDEYVSSAGASLEKKGFYEKEIHRVVEEYGSLVHVFSTYESYRSLTDEAPFARGINSIQLLNDGNRWWVLHIYWLGETEDNPLPARYLPD